MFVKEVGIFLVFLACVSSYYFLYFLPVEKAQTPFWEIISEVTVQTRLEINIAL